MLFVLFGLEVSSIIQTLRGRGIEVLVDGDEAGDALALLVHAPHDVPGGLRGGQHHVDTLVGGDEAEVDVEAVAEDECVTGPDDVGEAALPHALLGRVGREDHIQFWGNSFICDPYGRELALANQEQPDEIVAECPVEEIGTARTHWPFFRDRRVDAYDDLLKRWSDD